jgi:translation initiation factor IF-1
MPGEDAFQVEGTVEQVLGNGTYQVQLANGHRLLGYVAGRAKVTVRKFEPGEKVRLALSPCDLSEGRILVGKTEF